MATNSFVLTSNSKHLYYIYEKSGSTGYDLSCLSTTSFSLTFQNNITTYSNWKCLTFSNKMMKKRNTFHQQIIDTKLLILVTCTSISWKWGPYNWTTDSRGTHDSWCRSARLSDGQPAQSWLSRSRSNGHRWNQTEYRTRLIIISIQQNLRRDKQSFFKEFASFVVDYVPASMTL